jgi:hypothetical protein
MTHSPTRTTLTAAAIALGAALAPAPAQAGPILGAINATINRGGPGFGAIEPSFNQSGLEPEYIPGTTDYDSYIASRPLHSRAALGREWFGNLGSPVTVTYDLGAVFSVDAFALWNEEASGIGRFNLLASADGQSFGVVLSEVAPRDNPDTADYAPESFGFGAVDARFFRIEAFACPQRPSTFNACAIGEVAWRQADAANGVPEPATLPLVALLLAACLRRGGRSRASTSRSRTLPS